ncbi:MAG: YbhB/YbcL family Raf kinase inhibitor-like protein [Kiritimatiellae bacterium]|nr:YbhB/YbcL family Raf kinase inhibitor-like protein [Kiritimatiellia bacterium]
MRINGLIRRRLPLLLVVATWVIGACRPAGSESVSGSKGGEAMTFKLASSAFAEGAAIPVKYTGDGPDISPPLTWTDPPAGTKSLVLICDDPDAPVGTWVHWVLYDIPPTTRSLAEGIPTIGTVPGVGKQGKNDFRRLGYGGPAPPPGKPHRYFFKLYAVDVETGLAPGATKTEVLKAIEGHILAETRLMGTYKR